MRRAHTLRWLAVLGFVLFALPGCKKHEPSADSSGTQPKSSELPALTLKDDTEKLLLTWVQDDGNFRVGYHVSDVPAGSRKQVRVVVADKSEGTADQIYVANLDAKRADGSYPVSTMSRAAWDELGASRRKARLEALAPSAKPIESAVPGASAAAGNVVAIIYGAKWCGPCHQAAKYLTGRGVQVIDKDIDESPVAQRELRDKLTRASMPPTSSIPVIDIGGQLIVGFNAGALDHAIQAAQSGTRL